MDARGIATALLLLVAVGGLGWALYEDKPQSLAPLPSFERQAVAVSKSEARTALVGLLPRAFHNAPGSNATNNNATNNNATNNNATSNNAKGNNDAGRRERNRVVELWRAALQGVDDGIKTQRDAERLEMDVWLHRHRIAEIDDLALHQHLVLLVDRELQRRRTLFKLGFAGDDEVQQAEAILARERFAAGAKDSGYADVLTGYAVDRRKHFERLGLLKIIDSQVVRVEVDALRREFPPAETLAPKPSSAPTE